MPGAWGVMVGAGLVGLCCHPPTVPPTQPTRLHGNPIPEAMKRQAWAALGLSGPLGLLYVAIHAVYPIGKFQKIRSTVNS